MIGAIRTIDVAIAIARQTGEPSKDMVEIFGREEFDRSPSWWSRMWSGIGDFFSSLSFSWLGPVGQFLLWLVLVVAVLALLLFLWRQWKAGGLRFRRRRREKPEPSDIVPIEIDTITDPDQLRAERAAFEEERDYKQAILFRYRELVVTLMAARLVSNEPGRTTGELSVDVAGSAPLARPAFGRATDIFEVTWYSDHPPSREEFERLDREATEALAATHSPAVATGSGS